MGGYSMVISGRAMAPISRSGSPAAVESGQVSAPARLGKRKSLRQVTGHPGIHRDLLAGNLPSQADTRN